MGIVTVSGIVSIVIMCCLFGMVIQHEIERQVNQAKRNRRARKRTARRKAMERNRSIPACIRGSNRARRISQ